MNSHLIKPIETSYKGYRFRSRTEDRYAILFDGLGFKWGYEIEGFKLRSGAQYLPDFYLYDFDVWLEVKGSQETTSDREMEKIYDFSFQLEKNIIVAYEQPGDETMVFISPKHGIHEVLFAPNPFTGELQISVVREERFYDCSRDVPIYKRINHAYQQARSARFEFGERK
jgi:hypothetical protein